jgi:hypothetical protein
MDEKILGLEDSLRNVEIVDKIIEFSRYLQSSSLRNNIYEDITSVNKYASNILPILIKLPSFQLPHASKTNMRFHVFSHYCTFMFM